MFETLAIFAGLTGGTSLVVGIARVVPELAIDSPLELLSALVRGKLISEIYDHIREGWPQTKIEAYLIYGGLFLISLPVTGFWMLSTLD